MHMAHCTWLVHCARLSQGVSWKTKQNLQFASIYLARTCNYLRANYPNTLRVERYMLLLFRGCPLRCLEVLVIDSATGCSCGMDKLDKELERAEA
ncbi:hypothetical protein BDP27DRAFT_1323510 [Rhodocollybia butyracea]|uniref:Uncharacterized protein n=1 Tax=Rhodocollybia butyracea TaxID=206335 RepID=A0A9P5U947_9AGAR|nr:hypothetical protein BDP27DRAFT_1323510 [Rhodocollybia butyracea]